MYTCACVRACVLACLRERERERKRERELERNTRIDLRRYAVRTLAHKRQDNNKHTHTPYVTRLGGADKNGVR